MTGLKCANCGYEIDSSNSIFGHPLTCPRCQHPLAANAPPSLAPTSAPDMNDTLAPNVPALMGRPGAYAFLSPAIGDELGWLGSYRVLELLGQGGMGLVFRADDMQLQRPVALKVMRPEVASDQQSRQRFLREARSMAALKSDYIVTIHQVGQDKDMPYLAMEFLRGEPLDRWLELHPRPALKDATRMGLEIARGLAAAHKLGLIHRDIKPANIWLEEPGGRVKILDFGLARAAHDNARLTQTGLIIGTPAYMAPEQAEGTEVDARCDLFSLGCVLYELLAGEPAFQGGSTVAILKAVALKEPKPLREVNASVPIPLAGLVTQLLAKEPNDRPASAQAVAEALEAFIHDPNVDLGASGFLHTGAHGTPRKKGRPARRRVPLVSLVALLALIVVAGLLGRQYLQSRPGPNAGPTVRQPRPAIAQGVTDEQILLGMTGPFSGNAKAIGHELKVGIETYLNQVNEHGGVNGRKVKLIALDDKYDPATALANIKSLDREHKVFGFIGNVGTPTAELTLPYASQRDMLFFGAFTGTDKLRQSPPERVVFNYRASYEDETAAIIRYLILVKKLRPEQIAVFYQDDGYGKSGLKGVEKALRHMSLDADKIFKVTYQHGSNDTQEAADKILADKQIRAVVMVPVYKAAANFIRQIKDAKRNLIFANVSFVNSNALGEELGAEYGDGVIVSQVVPFPDASSNLVLEYKMLLKKYFPNEMPGFVSLEGYIDAKLLCQALAKVGDNLTTASAVAALEDIRNLDLGIGTLITYGPSDHEGSKKVWGTQIDKDGKFQMLDLEQ